MSNRQAVCPLSGGNPRNLPEGLYLKPKAGTYQYSFPATTEEKKLKKRGRKATLLSLLANSEKAQFDKGLIPLADAILIANQLNKKYRPTIQTEKPVTIDRSGYVPFEVDNYWAAYLNKLQKQGTKVYQLDSDGKPKVKTSGKEAGELKLTGNLESFKRHLDRLKEQYGQIQVADLRANDVEDWFFNSGVFPETVMCKAMNNLNRFFSHVGGDDHPNIYGIQRKLTKDNVLYYDPIKKRSRLTMKQFKAIRRLAIDAEDFMTVNGLDLAFTTLLRIGNIVQLRFDYDENLGEGVDSSNRLWWTPIKKDKALRRYVDLNLRENSEIKALINRCKATRTIAMNKGKSDRPCPHLVHNDYAYYRQSDNKEHAMSVTEDYLTERFSFYRDQLPDIAKLDESSKPSFHEIRSLGAYARLKETNLNYVSNLLGHTDLKTTKEFYLKGHGKGYDVEEIKILMQA